eukprot:gene17669-24019_t
MQASLSVGSSVAAGGIQIAGGTPLYVTAGSRVEVSHVFQGKQSERPALLILPVQVIAATACWRVNANAPESAAQADAMDAQVDTPAIIRLSFRQMCACPLIRHQHPQSTRPGLAALTANNWIVMTRPLLATHEKLPDDGQVYSCLADNCDSNCVNSRACIHFTQSAADVAGSLACKDAGPRMFDAAWARTSVVGSAQCYIASKNICIVQADIFAERGSGQCQFYQSGGGDCGKAKFQKYYAEKRDSLCTDIANGVVITLAGFSG